MIMKPTTGEVSEAKLFPNGWVYRIGTGYDPEGSVPPEGIVGAWQVNNIGEIVGEFKSNPKYQPSLPLSKK